MNHVLRKAWKGFLAVESKGCIEDDGVRLLTAGAATYVIISQS